MGVRFSFFTKINLLILLLALPVLGLYTYSSHVSTEVVTRELKGASAGQLSLLLEQLESRVEQTMFFSLTMLQDPTVKRFKGIAMIDSPYDLMETKQAILDKLNLQNLQREWVTNYSVFTTDNRQAVSNVSGVGYDRKRIDRAHTGRWEYRPAGAALEGQSAGGPYAGAPAAVTAAAERAVVSTAADAAPADRAGATTAADSPPAERAVVTTAVDSAPADRAVATSAAGLAPETGGWTLPGNTAGRPANPASSSGGKGEPAFYYYTHDLSEYRKSPALANVIIEASIPEGNIRRMLDEFKKQGQGDPFFFREGEGLIANSTANRALMDEMLAGLRGMPLGSRLTQTLRIGREDYLVTVLESPALGWYLVDYVPLKQVLAPITLSRRLFYTSIGLLAVLSLVASMLLYRNVQVPIKRLIHSVQNVKRGNYGVRLAPIGSYEFTYLFDKFNEMSSQIEELIDNVYKQQLRVREAGLKQLQSQINPHFLYNCLGFIINMAEMKRGEAVVTMAHNLSDYYRYTTRLEKMTATVDEELRLIGNYLEIQRLRTPRIEYEIQVPRELRSTKIPRLLLQPLVENAILHGISKSLDSGLIRVTGGADGTSRWISVEDDGAGLTDEAREALQHVLGQEMGGSLGFGLWNVHQRAGYHWNAEAGLRLESSELGGLRVTLQWSEPQREVGPEEQSEENNRRNDRKVTVETKQSIERGRTDHAAAASGR
ncbi:sensor histidine kinase [Paenibacillus sp. S-38]|uniref:sensor histidine kinase n=1 Tax=Paenibacillus sp. S-38 TaxID=3416710 RepID=UPI003CF38632